MSFEKWSEKHAPAVALGMSVLAFICSVAAFMNTPEDIPLPPQRTAVSHPPRGAGAGGPGAGGMPGERGGAMGRMRPDRGISEEYLKLYQERVQLLEEMVKSNELLFQAGALPMDELMNSRFSADCARVMLARLQMGGRPSPGLPEAVMTEKYWDWVLRNQPPAEQQQSSGDKNWKAALEWNQARLNLSRMDSRIVNNPRFQQAIEECLKTYPDKLSDEQIKTLVESERAF